mmetsp:Transcript_41644/g.106572  ORF Transcript_41644/g.106572 Transcript_41644/m.106572 type:complete len:517 (-) Transcript_41644:117-1667(-)
MHVAQPLEGQLLTTLQQAAPNTQRRRAQLEHPSPDSRATTMRTLGACHPRLLLLLFLILLLSRQKASADRTQRSSDTALATASGAQDLVSDVFTALRGEGLEGAQLMLDEQRDASTPRPPVLRIRSRYSTRSRGTRQDGGLIRGGGSSAEGAASRRTHQQCSAMFNARGTRCQPKRVPDCLDGVFRSFWVLNGEYYQRSSTHPRLPTRDGFRRISRTEYEDIASLLPQHDIFNRSSPVKSCALVGSDTSLRRSNYGEYIDRFDVVMRMNGAPTRGWEKQVGSKTTHRFVNNAYVGWREKDEVLISKWSGSTKQIKSYADKRTYVVNPRFLAYSQSKYFTARDHLATQGFRALLLLLHACTHVHVFGFTGSGGWYYNKQENRKRINKDLFVSRGGVVGDVEVEPGSLYHYGSMDSEMSQSDDEIRRREILAVRRASSRSSGHLPSGHKLKVERSCMMRLANRGILTHHFQPRNGSGQSNQAQNSTGSSTNNESRREAQESVHWKLVNWLLGRLGASP